MASWVLDFTGLGSDIYLIIIRIISILFIFVFNLTTFVDLDIKYFHHK